MASTKNMQQEAMASIDTAKAIIDKVLTIMDIILVSPSLSLSFSANPIGFLLQLLQHLGVTYEELRDWLTKYLIYIVPILETSVKAILLTNLKNMVSCSVDPRIPEKYRKRHKEPTNPNSSQEYGIDINIESIDFLDKLSVSPLSDEGKDMYFGLEGVEDVYKFARADDFDAFLWFVIHKAKFPNSSKINNINNLKDNIHGLNAKSVTPTNGSLLSPLEVTFSSDNPSSILLGNTFTYDGSPHIISMCIDRQYDEEDKIVKNTLVPVSDDWNSANWYKRNAYQLGKNMGFGWSAVTTKDSDGNTIGTSTKYNGKGRNFLKEKGICNLQYIDQASSDSPIVGTVNNKLRFTILPKPVTHIPNLKEGEPPFRFKKLLFNEKGEYDKNGKYTIADITDSQNLKYANDNVEIDPKTGKVTVREPKELVKELIECYEGLTIFEFNYDYVMSIKLFDAKTLATSLLNSLINTSVGVNIGLSQKHQDATEELKEIIRNIINSDENSTNDCYYSFDNSKYASLLKKSEEKRAKQQKFGNTTKEIGSFSSVRDILNEYDANADLNKQQDVINRAITQASQTITQNVDDSDKYSLEYGFVLNLIENLITSIVNAILSPKVLMLLEVNQQIMGGTWEKFTLKDLLKAMLSIIISIINDVRDLIIQELLKLVLSQLKPIIEMIGGILLREQLEDYSDAIMEIIRNCPAIWFSLGNRYSDTKLDTVDYADIDTTVITKNNAPKTNDC